MSRTSWMALALSTGCTGLNPAFVTSAGDGASASSTTGDPGATTTAATSSTGAGTSTGGASMSASEAGTSAGDTSGDAGTTLGATAGTTLELTGGDTTGGPSHVTCPQDQELAACYHFPADELAQLVDGSPHGMHGQMAVEGLKPAPPGFDLAARLGPLSTIVVPETGMNDALDLTGGITMTALVYLDELPAIGRAGILDKEAQYSLFVHADGGLRCQVADFAEPTGVVLPFGAWVHVACSFDGAAIRVYVDGVMKAEIPKAGVLQSFVQGDLVLGGNSPLPGERLIGALDAVEIWSVALPPDAICERAGPACP